MQTHYLYDALSAAKYQQMKLNELGYNSVLNLPRKSYAGRIVHTPHALRKMGQISGRDKNYEEKFLSKIYRYHGSVHKSLNGCMMF